MPTTATAEEPSRAGIVRQVERVTATVCLTSSAMHVSASRSQRVGDLAAAWRRHRRQQRPPAAPIDDHERDADRDDRAAGSTKIGSMPPVGSPRCTNSQATPQAEPAADAAR